MVIELQKANGFTNWASVILESGDESAGKEGSNKVRDARAAVAIDTKLRVGGSDQKQLTGRFCLPTKLPFAELPG